MNGIALWTISGTAFNGVLSFDSTPALWVLLMGALVASAIGILLGRSGAARPEVTPVRLARPAEAR